LSPRHIVKQNGFTLFLIALTLICKPYSLYVKKKLTAPMLVIYSSFAALCGLTYMWANSATAVQMLYFGFIFIFATIFCLSLSNQRMCINCYAALFIVYFIKNYGFGWHRIPLAGTALDLRRRSFIFNFVVGQSFGFFMKAHGDFVESIRNALSIFLWTFMFPWYFILETRLLPNATDWASPENLNDRLVVMTREIGYYIFYVIVVSSKQEDTIGISRVIDYFALFLFTGHMLMIQLPAQTVADSLMWQQFILFVFIALYYLNNGNMGYSQKPDSHTTSSTELEDKSLTLESDSNSESTS